MLKFNVLDIVMLIVLSLSIIFGIIKGFIRELLSLAFFIIAVVLAALYYSDVGKWLGDPVKDKDIANFIGFILIFTTVLIIGTLITYFTKSIFTIGPLKSIDKILGGLFGLVRGILIASIIVFALVAFPVNDSLVLNSRLSPYIMKTIDVVMNFVPLKYRQKFKPPIRDLEG